MMTWWHHKAKVEHVGGVKIFRTWSKWIQKEKKKKTANQKPKLDIKKVLKKRKKKPKKKETSFPIKPGGGSRSSRLSRDWSIPETAEQNKAETRLCWCHASLANRNQFLCFCHHRRGDSLPLCDQRERSHWLVLTFCEKVLQSRSAKTLHSSSPRMPCCVLAGFRRWR